MIKNSQITSSDLLKEAVIEIRHISPYIDRSKLDEIPHRHPFHEIIYILSGSGKHTIDGEPFALTSNTIYVIGEGQVHEFIKGENLKGYLLRYKDSFLPSELTKFTANYALLQMVSDSNSLHLNDDEAEVFKANFDQLVAEYNISNTIENNQVFQFLLLALLSRINNKIRNTSEQSISQSRDQKNAVFQKFMLLVEDHYKSEHYLEFYAQALDLNQRKLSSKIESKSGQSPKQLINRRIIIEAKRLIQFTNLSFKEISYELGFGEPAYFSRLFKIKTGVSPKVYRGERV